MGSISTYAIKRPLARADGLLVQELEGETVVYDLESKQAHCLKALAAIVFAGADGTKSRADLAELTAYQLGAPVTEADVADAVSQLDAAGLLEAPLRIRLSGERDEDERGVPRREALRRIGLAGASAAVATSMITSIVAPNAAFAAGQSGIPAGCPGCGQNSDCISNHCCQPVSGKQCAQTCCVGKDNSCHFSSCTCVGGTTPGSDCTSTGTCGGDGVCQCNCTVCLSSLDTGQCPSSCPGGLPPCCTTTC